MTQLSQRLGRAILIQASTRASRGWRTRRGALAQTDENAFLVADDDAGPAIAVEVRRGDLGAHPGIVVNQMRDEPRLAAGFAPQLEPEHDGGRIRLRVALGAMGSESFARHHVLHAVAIHVRQVKCVQLAHAERL